MQQYQQSPSHNPDLPGGSVHRQLPSRCNNNFYSGVKHQNQVPPQQQPSWSSFSPSKSPWSEQSSSGGSGSHLRPMTPSHKSFTLPGHGLLDPRQQQQPHYQLMESFIVEDHKVSHEGVDESGGQCVIVSGTTASAAGGLSKRPPKDAAATGSGKEQRGMETNVSSRPRSSEHWTPERGVGGGASRQRGGGVPGCRGRGGSSIYSGSLPRLGRTGASNNSAFVTSATLPAPGASGLESGDPVYPSASGPLLSPGLSVTGAAGGGGWWKGSSTSEPRDSDGSTTSSGAAATKKEEDVHGSMLSLISNTSSVFSTPEEKQMQEVRKLKRELDAAHEKISTLTAQLSTNVHVVTAFEQSLANMTHRLQKLTVSSERKDCELNDLRAALQSLQHPGSHTPQDFHQQHGMTSQPGSCGSTPRHIRSAQLSLSSNNAAESSNESPSQQLQLQQQQHLPTSSDSDLSMSSHSSVNSNTAQQQNTSTSAAAAAAAAAAEKKRTSWLSSSFRKAFSRRKSKQHCSFDSESPGGGTADDTIVTSCGGGVLPTTSLPTSPLLPCGGTSRTHSSIPCTPINGPRRMSASTLDNGVDDVDDHLSSEQLVVILNEQLHEKDMKLTDVRLEALSSAHQLEQLREMLSQMKVEMLQLKADNERMQRTITRNGLKEQLVEMAEDGSPAFRKKLSLGGPTTFDTIALETSNKDSQRFVVYVQLMHNAEYNTTTTTTDQDNVMSHRLLVGSIALTSKTRWAELDDVVSQTFMDYVNHVDPGSGLGLNEDSILDYDVGDIKRTKGAKPPELLPCGYLVGSNRDIIVRLRGVEEAEVDLLAFETLIPKSIVERYVSLLLEHRRLILCGPSGTGKTFLAHRLAEYLQHRSGQQQHHESIATFTVDQKSSRELRQYLSNVADQCSAAGDVTTDASCDSSRATTAAPTVIVVDNLHHVASLGDAFGRFLGDGQHQQQSLNKSPYIIGTMRQTTSSTSADLQLTHHNFRWVLFANHTEPVRGLLSRYLQRQLIAAQTRHHGGVVGAELERVVTWLPKTWNHVNRFLTTHCSAEVTLGPRLFLSCPMEAAASCLWFADLWNYSIVPYLLEALREAKQSQPSVRDVTWEDPADWVASHLPWSDTNASPGGCRGDMPSLLRLRPDETGSSSDADVNSAASASSRPTTATVEHRANSRPSSNDPLMTMLLRLQEVTMCSSVYGGDGLELELTDSRSNRNQAAFV